MGKELYYVEYKTKNSNVTLEELTLGQARRTARRALEEGATDISITKEEMQYSDAASKWGCGRPVATLVWKEDYPSGERTPVNTRFCDYHLDDVPVEEWERFCMIRKVVMCVSNYNERFLNVYLTNGHMVWVFPDGDSYRMNGATEEEKEAASVVMGDYLDWLTGNDDNGDEE